MRAVKEQRFREQGFAPAANELNIGWALRHREELHAGHMLRLDTFSGRIMLCRQIPRPEVAPIVDFVPRPYEDNDTTHLTEWFQAEEYGGSVEVGRVEAAVSAEAHRNSYSSAAEHLLSLPEWDGEERLSRFFLDVCGVDVTSAELGSDDEREELIDYLGEVATILFGGIVTRTMEPGSKFDTMVVLEGAQGIGKSTLLRVIALKDEWFSDSLPHDLSSKDARLHLPGKLIVEMPEISQVNRSTIETIKAYLSAQTDTLRPPFGRHEGTHLGQCVFVGTTNERAYLKDDTGNRRFLPIECGRIDLELARTIMPQLYAEALNDYRAGKLPMLSAKAGSVAERLQREHVTDDVWEERIRDHLRQLQHAASLREETEVAVSIGEVLSRAIEMDASRQDRAAQTRVGVILAKLGAKKKRLRIDGRPTWVSVLSMSPKDGRPL